MPVENKALKGRKYIPKSSKLGRPKKTKPFKKMHFRKLTFKSILGFGNNRDYTVEKVIKYGRSADLCKIYYTMSHITFFDDVLLELGLTAEWRIDKPGTNRDKYFEFMWAVKPEEAERRKENLVKALTKNSKQYLKQVNIKDDSKEYHRQQNLHRYK